jgi:small subunit ribosomal protein S10
VRLKEGIDPPSVKTILSILVNRGLSKKIMAEKTTAKKKSSKKVASGNGAPQKLRIKVQAYEYKVLDISVKQIIDTALRFEAEVRGPIPLPTANKKYTVNRSSFVHEDAREQFEMRVHKRLIDIINPSQKIIESLTNINLPNGVSIDVKIV